MSGTRVPILYLAPWVDFGGSDKGTIDWFRWIDRSRFAPSLITTQPSSNSRLAEIVPFAEEVWPLPDLMVGDRFPPFIAGFIASREIEIVHIMNSRMGFDLLPDLRALERRPRIVVQLHVEEPTRDGYVRYVTTRYGNLVDAFSVSSGHLAEIVEGYSVSSDRIEVIHTGVDAERELCPELVRPRAGLGSEHVHILYPGRLVEQKDPLKMVEVARELDARGLEFQIHVVGGGELEGEVRNRVTAQGLARRVRFEPPTRELAPWYAAADLLLMTSVFEGVPYVVYEALAMRVPVVAPALPGTVELMGKVGGTLVERPGSARDYADALEPLIRDRTLRESAGDAGRSLVLDRYTLREMADRHAGLYDRLLENDRREDPSAAPELGPSVREISFSSRPSRGMPRVSIVTPCFNHARWLRECVASVRAQTYPDVEMIVVDDASTQQESVSYLDELARDPDVRVLRMAQNSGPSAARNLGLDQVTGRYVLPVDADNVLLPDAVERLVAQLQGAGERIGYIYQNLQYFGNREDYFEPPAFNAWLLTQGNYIDTCALIDRAVFDHGLRYPEDIVLGHEDWDFFLTLASRGVYGEPARSKTLRYRKHGFTRSDIVDWTESPFHAQLPLRHPTLFPVGAARTRGENPQTELKARWAPALTVIALGACELDSWAFDTVVRRLRRQRLRDFELYVATDREPALDRTVAPVHSLPARLLSRPAEALVYALQRTGARNIVVTSGTGAELLADPGSLERLVRLLEYGPSPVIGFADAGQAERYPWCILPGDDPGIDLHSLAWSRAHLPLREPPPPLDEGDPVGDLGRWHQLRRIHVEWRHLPAVSVRRASPSGTRSSPAQQPILARAEATERHARLDAPPSLPGALSTVARWAALPWWTPARTLLLVRHRHRSHRQWVVNTTSSSPDDYEFDHRLGLVYNSSLEGTARIVIDAAQGFSAVGRGEPDANEMAGTVGYADQVAFPLLEPLMLCRHAEMGTPVLVCGADDPLRPEVEWPQIAVLGWIDRWPVNPPLVPRAPEATAWLRGLVRTVDLAHRRHRIAVGAAPPGDTWELGALLDRDPGAGIPAWVDSAGLLWTRTYTPRRSPFSPRRTLHWAAAPLGWRGFSRPVPRARSVARRSIDAVRHSLVRPELGSTPRTGAPYGWLLSEPGPHRIPIYSAIHAVTADQLVTRDPSEARELGYEALRMLGYALAVAPVTGTLARPPVPVPWGSRFGQALTRSEDPCQ